MSLVGVTSCLRLCSCFFFFFKQKTAYEMRISDWSSDVCSSDLGREAAHGRLGRSPFDAVPRGAHEALPRDAGGRRRALEVALRAAGLLGRPALRDRKSVV